MKKRLIVFALIFVLFLYACSKAKLDTLPLCTEDDSADECNRKKSIAYNDESHCAKIEDAELGTDCFTGLAAFKMDFKVCNGLTDEFQRDMCIRTYAYAKRDLPACDAVRDSNQKDLCIRNVAIAKKDISLCNSVQREMQKELCVSAIQKEQP